MIFISCKCTFATSLNIVPVSENYSGTRCNSRGIAFSACTWRPQSQSDEHIPGEPFGLYSTGMSDLRRTVTHCLSAICYYCTASEQQPAVCMPHLTNHSLSITSALLWDHFIALQWKRRATYKTLKHVLVDLVCNYVCDWYKSSHQHI